MDGEERKKGFAEKHTTGTKDSKEIEIIIGKPALKEDKEEMG